MNAASATLGPLAQVLIVLTAPPSLESEIIDWLLGRDLGFTSTAVHGHGTRHDHLSIAEQVSGRQRRLQFQVALDAERLDGFLAALGAELGGADLHYWVLPLIAGGRLGG